LKAALVKNHGQRIGYDPFIVHDKHFGFELCFGHTLLKVETGTTSGSLSEQLRNVRFR
jgi:hypothetical protein